MTSLATIAAPTDLYDAVISSTDFLSDLPALKDATDISVAKCVAVYMEQVTEDMGLSLGWFFLEGVVADLTKRAWSAIEARADTRRAENERAYHAHGTEYSTHYNAN